MRTAWAAIDTPTHYLMLSIGNVKFLIFTDFSLGTGNVSHVMLYPLPLLKLIDIVVCSVREGRFALRS